MTKGNPNKSKGRSYLDTSLLAHATEVLLRVLVDRNFIWQVLVRIQATNEVIKIIRQLHDGIQACVRFDDGGIIDWFEVEPDLYQG